MIKKFKFADSKVGEVRCMIDDIGSYVHLSDTARLCDVTTQKDGKDVIDRQRVDSIMVSIGAKIQGLNSYIPTYLFALFCCRVNEDYLDYNSELLLDIAEEEVKFRKEYGSHESIQDALDANQVRIEKVEAQLRKVQEENEQLEYLLLEKSHIKDYKDKILASTDLRASQLIGRDYGHDGEWLLQTLAEAGIMRKTKHGYLLEPAFVGQGYTHTMRSVVPDADGGQIKTLHVYWTQKGHLFIYNTLKTKGIEPKVV